MEKSSIALLPIGHVEKPIVEAIEKALGEAFDRGVTVVTPLTVPAEAYRPSRQQYLGESFLQQLLTVKAARYERILGICDVDLYTEGLNFIFGEASAALGVAIISLSRLRQEFYGLPGKAELFMKRAAKEALHEVGHTYEMRHCPDCECVMHFSNSLADTDRKREAFCVRCRMLLDNNLKRMR